MSGLFGRMKEEALHRPGLAPSADDAFAAFAKAGVPIEDQQQSLATTYKAAYCRHGLTHDKDVAVLVCEYRDPAAAAVGLEMSQQTLKTIVHRKSWSHKALMMATMPQDPSGPPAAMATIGKVVAAFNSL
jgi:hypothetical protein